MSESLGRLVVTAVTVEGRTKAAVARDYGVSRQWVHELCRRYAAEGEAGLVPGSRRPRTNPHRVPESLEDRIVALRKELADQGLDAGAHTIAYHLGRERLDLPSVATIWRILTRRGFVTPQPQKRPKAASIRFCAEMPNERWQEDITHWTLADGTDVEIGGRRPAEAYRARPKDRPRGPVIDTTYRVRRDRIDAGGAVTLRHDSRLLHIKVGRRQAGMRVADARRRPRLPDRDRRRRADPRAHARSHEVLSGAGERRGCKDVVRQVSTMSRDITLGGGEGIRTPDLCRAKAASAFDLTSSFAGIPSSEQSPGSAGRTDHPCCYTSRRRFAAEAATPEARHEERRRVKLAIGRWPCGEAESSSVLNPQMGSPRDRCRRERRLRAATKGKEQSQLPVGQG